MKKKIGKPIALGILTSVLRVGAHWSGIGPPNWLCLLVRRGYAGFFPEMEKRMAHYTAN